MSANKISAKLAQNFKPALIVASVACSVLAAMAQTAAPGVVALTPVEMKWSGQGGLAAQGMEQLNLVGDPAQPGPYTVRLKFPKGLKIAPHTHPDSREVTILSGVYATGYGDTFEAAKLKTLPAGSFYTEPADQPHFARTGRDPALVFITGNGPSDTQYVDAGADPTRR